MDRRLERPRPAAHPFALRGRLRHGLRSFASRRFNVDLSLSAIEASFGRALVRVHRNWLVNLAHVRELERDGGATSVFVGSGVGPESCGVRAPVSRDHAQELREMLLACSTGLKRSVT